MRDRGGVGHPLRVRPEARVGQRISTSASGGRGVCAISPSFGVSEVVVGSDRDAGSCTGWLPLPCSRARFLVLPRRREPSLGPRLRGETCLAGGLGWPLSGPHEALPRGARSRGHAPPRPSPEGEGVLSCHHAISARHATHCPRGRGTLSSGLMITLRHGAQLKEWIHAKALRREEKTGQVR